MGVEAQRIMAVSMSKIQTSRNRRTGVDLHRNLLITAVLHKARTAFLADSYEAARTFRQAVERGRIESEKHQVSLSAPCQNTSNFTELRVPEPRSDYNYNGDGHEPMSDTSDTDSDSEFDESEAHLDCNETLGLDESFEEECCEKCDSAPVLYTLQPISSHTMNTSTQHSVVESIITSHTMDSSSLHSRLDCGHSGRDCVRNCSGKRLLEADDDEVFESKRLKPEYPSEDFEDSCQVSHLVNILNNGLSGLTNSLSSFSTSQKEVSCSITLNSDFTSSLSLSRPILAMAMV